MTASKQYHLRLAFSSLSRIIIGLLLVVITPPYLFLPRYTQILTSATQSWRHARHFSILLIKTKQRVCVEDVSADKRYHCNFCFSPLRLTHGLSIQYIKHSSSYCLSVCACIKIFDSAMVYDYSDRRRLSLSRSHHVFLRDLLSTVALILLLCFTLLLNVVVVILISARIPINGPPLKDLVFRLIPYQDWAETALYPCLSVCVFCLFSTLFFHDSALFLFRRTLFLGSCMFLARAICTSATYFPSPNRSSRACQHATIALGNFTLGDDTVYSRLENFKGTIDQYGWQKTAEFLFCTDNAVFCGTSIIFVLSTLVVQGYCPLPWRPIVPLVTRLTSIFGIACILLSRQNYTINVAISFTICYGIYKVYHDGIVRIINEDAENQDSALLSLFRWENGFEQESMLKWPLPWPKCCQRFCHRWNRRASFYRRCPIIVSDEGKTRQKFDSAVIELL